jgi:2-oxoglutarate dehydrogenase E2 component (dihydrolipoamide succinyltransferase)
VAAPKPAVPAKPAAAPAPQAPATVGPDVRQTRKKMTPIRKRIAQRLIQAQSEAAILTTFNEVDMTNIMALRKQYQDSFVKKYGIKLGFMSFFVKAVVDALQNVPGINAFIEGDEIVQNHFYDIGIAVGTERGLVVPVVRNADQLNFAEVEMEIGNLAKKARDKRLTLDDLSGGSFSITNGGIYGSLLSTPILNPPQSGILGMHGIKKRPVAVGDKVEIRPMMYLALSYDHRLVDGKEAVTFLKRIVECIENPERILLDV